MTSLVIAEHDNASIKGATLNTVTAALACGGDVHVLIAGHNAAAAAQAAASHQDSGSRGWGAGAAGRWLIKEGKGKVHHVGFQAVGRRRLLAQRNACCTVWLSPIYCFV